MNRRRQSTLAAAVLDNSLTGYSVASRTVTQEQRNELISAKKKKVNWTRCMGSHVCSCSTMLRIPRYPPNAARPNIHVDVGFSFFAIAQICATWVWVYDAISTHVYIRLQWAWWAHVLGQHSIQYYLHAMNMMWWGWMYAQELRLQRGKVFSIAMSLTMSLSLPMCVYGLTMMQ